MPALNDPLNRLPRVLSRRARGTSWLATPLHTWGPVVTDARRLWSHRVVEIIAARVGADLPDVADKLLSMRSQHRYLLIASVAQTRRCTVFAAVDQLLAREVALKVHHERDDETTWRLLAEAQAMSRFDHPNIVRVHEVGDHEGCLYSFLGTPCPGPGTSRPQAHGEHERDPSGSQPALSGADQEAVQ